MAKGSIKTTNQLTILEDVMNKKDYQQQQMLQEYTSLRLEILQTYERQANLVYSAAITAAGTLIISLVQSQASLFSLPILLVILMGISNKSIGNYIYIFRIGSYLTVVHEQQGMSADHFMPGPNTAAWHSRWRRLSRSKELRKNIPYRIGAEAPLIESWFIGLLGLCGWVLVIGIFKSDLFSDPFNIAIFCISVVLSLFLTIFLFQLASVNRISIHYENAFRNMIDMEKVKKQR
ncbi:MAG: hypothetical protein HZB50_12040 [Chloroflexi bacterium]|nr:hypothetical protein [Chloroflexota bacterium]